MRLVRNCPNGHTWEQTVAELSGEPLPDACPVCGETSTIATRYEEGTADELPPPPGERPLRLSHGAAAAAPPSLPGYEMLEELGRGGMGVVYRARQLRPQRLVALKMTLWGPRDSAEQLRRFEVEANAIAALEHENIVRIYEFGEHPSGPFFSMELVEGGSLESRIRQATLDPAQAATLIVQVAGAIDLAHQRGIVHRDIKPSNILLTPQDVPKVTDFGIAKQLDQPAVTATDSMLGTPSYMAPEQAAAGAAEIDARTDVYALGAVLYDTLAGRPPFRGGDMWETFQQLRDTEPVPLRRLRPAVPRDLETICHKCLEKDPRQRYETARALADDLQRHLDGRPIQARPAGQITRLIKLARRRRTATALLATLALLLVTSAFSGWLYFVRMRAERDKAVAAQEEAENHLSLALDAARRFKTQVANNQLLDVPGQEELRKELIQEAVTFYDTILDVRGHDERVVFERANSQAQLGVLLRETGSGQRGLQQLQEAIGTYRRLLEHDPNRADYRNALAGTLNSLGMALRSRQNIEGTSRAWNEALQIRRDLLDELGGDQAEDVAADMLSRNIAQSLHNFGNLHRSQREFALAGDYYQQAWSIQQRLAEKHTDLADPATARFHRDLALTGQNLGWLAHDEQKRSLAAEWLLKALDIWQSLLAAHPQSREYRSQVADNQMKLGELYFQQTELELAVESLQHSLDEYNKLMEDFSQGVTFRRGAAEAHRVLARVLRAQGKGERAGEHFAEAIRLFELLLQREPGDAESAYMLAHACSDYGMLLNQQGEIDESLRWLRRSVDKIDKLREQHPSRLDFAIDSAGMRINDAKVIRRAGDLETATRYAQAAAETFDQLTAAGGERAEPALQDLQLRSWRRLAQSVEMLCWASDGQHRKAAERCEQLLRDVDPRLLSYHNLAATLSVCAAAAAADQSLTAQERASLADAYRQSALDVIRRAEHLGWYGRAQNVQELLEDPDLDPLREQAEFKQLVQQIADRTPTRD